MKITRKVQLITYKDIKDFVSVATKYGDDLKIKGQKCKFPACSLISVLSLLDLEKPIKIEFYEDKLQEVNYDFDDWIIE